LTLIEVVVSILLVTVIVTAAMAARYLTVKQAVRADAYNTAGRLALLLLEGWRSTQPALYDPTVAGSPLSSLGTVTITGGAAGCPAAPSGFTTLNTYRVVADRMNFYVRLAYTNPDLTENAWHPARLHVGVAFLNNYGIGDASASPNRVSLTTYR
jgi:Tfp pilus assembly protein PilV